LIDWDLTALSAQIAFDKYVAFKKVKIIFCQSWAPHRDSRHRKNFLRYRNASLKQLNAKFNHSNTTAVNDTVSLQ